jgi:DNA-binding transcriptional MocR family regulator
VGGLMKKYLFVLEEDVPKYIQVSRNIKKLIDSGLIADGEKLPSIRTLSELLKVNTVTVVNAYKRLQVDGYAYQKIGSGTFAKKKEFYKNFKKEYSETFKKISAGLLKTSIDFTGETTSSNFFPVEIFKDVLNEVLDRDGSDALVYQDVLGFHGLRESICSFFWDKKISEEDILVVSGAQQGIDVASKAIINVNDNVIIEKPTYSGAISVFSWRRANIFEVDMNDDGVDIEAFEKILQKNKIKTFYTMSYFQNPTGATYSLEKKLRLLELAEKYDFYIIEDDYLSELIYDHNIKYKSFKSLDNYDRVIYIKSFSKIFLPGIRMGYLIAPKKFKEAIYNSKINTDISTSSLMQRALDLYLNKGYWKEHISFLSSEYKKRYTFMCEYISKSLGDLVYFNPPGGGLNVFLKLNGELKCNSMDIFYSSQQRGVLITPGVIFYKNPKEGERSFRLGFAQTDEKMIRDGLEIIKGSIMEER